jgi:hypothetical protein
LPLERIFRTNGPKKFDELPWILILRYIPAMKSELDDPLLIAFKNSKASQSTRYVVGYSYDWKKNSAVKSLARLLAGRHTHN